MEGTMAYITPWAANFTPKAWMSCEGQILPISSYSALYSLIGTTYGGDGRTTFALPDLRSRLAIGAGQGPGLPEYRLGQKSGSETNTLTVAEMAIHTHSMIVTSEIPVNSNVFDADSPEAAYPAPTQDSSSIYNDSPSTFSGALSVTSQIGNTGGQIPVNNIQPYLSLYYIICVQGVFPSRG